ncbi:MAG: class I SAM-dependent methyltransferase [Gammaproteobacteria bacterium]|nr:class I SAM-dependent methyltransferase [Gammaproteobacteria bacterium]
MGLRVENTHEAPDDWHLACRDGRLTLCHPSDRPFALSYDDVQRRIESARTSSVAKACGADRRPNVLDALGGWALDAITLARAGCYVTVTEANPIVCAMAKNLAREADVRTTFVCGSVEEYSSENREFFDVVYLDPIFPQHPKGALPSRRMQILQILAKTDTDLMELFKIAREHSFNRVVVKLRRNQSSLFESPDWQILGNAVRFDIYRTSV